MPVLENYPVLSHQEQLRLEKELLGLYLSGHPLDQVKEEIGRMPYSIDKLNKSLEDQSVKIGGLLTECRRIITRSKREMIIAKIEDLSGNIPLLLFQSREFESNSQLFEDGNIVSVTGKVRNNDDEISLICEQIEVLRNISHEPKLYIDLENLEDASVLANIKQISRQYRGSLPIYFMLNEKTVLADRKYWLQDNELCLKQIENLVGAGRIFKM